MKKLGIIGGLGPWATAYFYSRVVELTPALRDQDHIETIIYSVPQIPDRTAFLLGEPDAEDPRPALVDAGRMLAQNGAEVIAIPCITAHAFHQEMEKGIGLTVMHAIRELGKLCWDTGISKLGILATDGARLSRIYDDVLAGYGVTCIWPDKEGQKQVMDMIYGEVKSGKKISEEVFYPVAEGLFSQGAEAVVLGCTELSQAKAGMKLNDKYIDIIDVLASACVRECRNGAVNTVE